MLPFDREKYLQIAKTQGVNAALTALHIDVERMEYQTFEGQDGWKPEDWQKLHSVRDFSRELWQMDLDRIVAPKPTHE